MIQAIASWFGVFSDFWNSSRWGDAGAVMWPLNAIACALVAIEAFALLHFSHSRWMRLSYGLVSAGGFAYFAGEIGGLYNVVAPVETFFHWAIVVRLGASIWGRVKERARERRREAYAQSH